MSVVRRWSVLCASLAVTTLFCRPAHAQTASDDIVLRTATVSPIEIRGDWVRVDDPTAAGGAALSNPDRSQARVAPALASPSSYFEMRFSARGGTPYHLWIRMKAGSNSRSNDSVHVQFSDAVNSLNQPIIRIGSTSSAELALQSGESGAPPHDWGWTDNGWSSLGWPIYFAADGAHVIRIQQREDGAELTGSPFQPWGRAAAREAHRIRSRADNADTASNAGANHELGGQPFSVKNQVEP